MKITTIKYMERKNLGNYEHEELSAEAIIGETDDYVASMLTLKDLVHNTLHGTLNKPIIKEEVKEVVAEVVKEEKPKAVRAKKSAVVIQEQASTEQVVVNATSPSTDEVEEVKKEKPKKVTKYSSDIPEHKSIFGAYLAKKYGDAWKTAKPVAEIKAFTASLNGKDFLDDVGTVVPSFIELVHGFFG